MMPRRAGLAVGSLVLAAATLHAAGGQAPAQQPAPAFRAAADVVGVEVSVRHGTPVTSKCWTTG